MRFRLFTLLALLALALSTWFLSSPRRTQGTGAAAGGVENPGYFLKDGVLTEYDVNGDPTIRIAARRIDQIPHSDEVELHDIRVDYQAPSGTAWIMVGDLAHVRPGGTMVDLSGNVVLHGADSNREDAPVIHTNTLTYDVTQSVASTSGDVRIDFLQHTLTARGLVANLRARTIRLESRINGRFHP
jgi:LPS export ABC transporter protein LptC